MTEAMNKNTVPKVERPRFFSRLIGRYAMYRYMPPLPDEFGQEEVDLDALAKDIEACAQAGVAQVMKDLESDGIILGTTVVDEAEALRISRCIVLDDLRTLAEADLE